LHLCMNSAHFHPFHVVYIHSATLQAGPRDRNKKEVLSNGELYIGFSAHPLKVSRSLR
jgi:hypothetical protein